MPRTSGAAYAVCIDCSLLDNTKGKWSLVNGNDPTLASEDQAKPVRFRLVVFYERYSYSRI
jgi:hypothetical protein